MADAVREAVEVIRADVLAGTRHGFLGRRGGVSQGVVAGLNVGLGAIGPAGDSAAAVAENRARAVAAVAAGARLVTAYQVHSARCVVAGDWADDARPEADALVTDRDDIVLGVLTADCTPVLFADRAGGVIGAAHAGWKGAVAGVCEATIDAMVALGADRGRIVAAIGPTIAQPSYEVDAGFRDRFIAQSAENARFFQPGAPGHWQFALPGYVAARLAAAGIGAIEDSALDTYADPDRFFSFRRASHRGEASYGRQVALIAR